MCGLSVRGSIFHRLGGPRWGVLLNSSPCNWPSSWSQHSLELLFACNFVVNVVNDAPHPDRHVQQVLWIPGWVDQWRGLQVSTVFMSLGLDSICRESGIALVIFKWIVSQLLLCIYVRSLLSVTRVLQQDTSSCWPWCPMTTAAPYCYPPLLLC